MTTFARLAAAILCAAAMTGPLPALAGSVHIHIDTESGVRAYDPFPLQRKYYPEGSAVNLEDSYINGEWLPAFRRLHVARCEAKYESYDWRSDTFLGRDNLRHRCKLGRK